MGIPVEVVAPTPPGVVVDVVFILSLPLPLALLCLVQFGQWFGEEQARDSSLTV